MKNGLKIFLGLTLLAALAEGLVLIRIRIDPWRLAALMESVALLLGAFVGLTQTAFVRQLRHWAMASPPLAGGLPFLLLFLTLFLGWGPRTFSLPAFGKFIAYILVPTALLLPDRLHHRESINWRDAGGHGGAGGPGIGGMVAGNLDLAPGHLCLPAGLLRSGGRLHSWFCAIWTAWGFAWCGGSRMFGTLAHTIGLTGRVCSAPWRSTHRTIAMRGHRHPINNTGIVRLVQQIQEFTEKNAEQTGCADRGSCPRQRLNGRPATCIRVAFPAAETGVKAYLIHAAPSETITPTCRSASNPTAGRRPPALAEAPRRVHLSQPEAEHRPDRRRFQTKPTLRYP